MKFFTPNTRKISINITSLIDILFLIIIFFSLTTRFDNERERNLNLPTSSAKDSAEISERLVILVDAANQIYVGDQSHTIESLANFLEAYDQSKSDPALLKIDEGVRHGTVISLLDLLEKSGFEKVSFATALR